MIARPRVGQRLNHRHHQHRKINQPVFKLLRCHLLTNQKSKINNHQSSITLPLARALPAFSPRLQPHTDSPASANTNGWQRSIARSATAPVASPEPTPSRTSRTLHGPQTIRDSPGTVPTNPEASRMRPARGRSHRAMPPSLSTMHIRNLQAPG